MLRCCTSLGCGHRGHYSYQNNSPDFVKSFDQLWSELNDKVAANDPNSDSVKLVNQGVHAVGKKVVEEASEAWMACEHENKDRAAEEISQLLYQTQLLMLAANVSIDDVYKKL